ncbi:PAS domain S-box protein [Methanoregula sp.]|uniref:PAS domain S-box protein n=1 Tax=Methanoregula sp. TaxID=2052170 RepID=UPI002C3EA7CC|nr:PAS domain S-box protein [Methanoregula sp.]HVP96774.1 PAS domain S-box protein [Methanoregula sp.]
MTAARILIVEDERIVAEDLRLTLIQLGYEIAGSTGTGEEAVRLAREASPDLILMDIYLAGKINGITATEEIRKFSPVPVVYLTAFADTAIMEKARVTQPYGYILKPYQERELNTVIEISLYKYQIDRQLRESEEKYRCIVETANEGIWGIDAEGKTTLVNRQMATLIGHSPDEITGHRIIEFIFPGDLPIFSRELEEQRSGKPGSYDLRMLHRDGTVRWMHISATPVYDEKGAFSGSFSMFTDIHDRVTAQEKLHQVNEELEMRVRERTASLNHQVHFLQQLIDTIPSPVYYKDRDFRYLGCNRTFEGYLGLSREAIIGKTPEDILPGDLAALTLMKDTYLLGHQGIQVYQIKFPHQDKSIRDLIVKKATFSDSTGKTIGIIGVMMDISERVRAEEALLESEKRFRAVVQDQSELIYRFGVDRRILFANKAFLEYFALDENGTVGYIFRLPVHPDDKGAVDSHFASLVPDHPVGLIEYRCVRSDGTVVWQQWSNRAFFDANGNVTEFQSVGRDITLKKEIEEQQRRLYRQIEQNLQQFATLNDHIRNPLTVIMMLAGIKDDDHSRKIIERSQEIQSILERMDAGYLESEKIRMFLRKHYNIEG